MLLPRTALISRGTAVGGLEYPIPCPRVYDLGVLGVDRERGDDAFCQARCHLAPGGPAIGGLEHPTARAHVDNLRVLGVLPVKLRKSKLWGMERISVFYGGNAAMVVS